MDPCRSKAIRLNRVQSSSEPEEFSSEDSFSEASTSVEQAPPTTGGKRKRASDSPSKTVAPAYIPPPSLAAFAKALAAKPKDVAGPSRTPQAPAQAFSQTPSIGRAVEILKKPRHDAPVTNRPPNPEKYFDQRVADGVSEGLKKAEARWSATTKEVERKMATSLAAVQADFEKRIAATVAASSQVQSGLLARVKTLEEKGDSASHATEQNDERFMVVGEAVVKLDSSVASLRSKYEASESSRKLLEAKLLALEERSKKDREEIAQLRTQLDASRAAVDAQGAKTKTLEARVDDVERAAQGAEALIHPLSVRIASLDEQIASYNSTTVTLSSELDATRDKMVEHSSATGGSLSKLSTRLDDGLATLNNSILSLKSDTAQTTAEQCTGVQKALEGRLREVDERAREDARLQFRSLNSAVEGHAQMLSLALGSVVTLWAEVQALRRGAGGDTSRDVMAASGGLD